MLLVVLLLLMLSVTKLGVVTTGRIAIRSRLILKISINGGSESSELCWPTGPPEQCKERLLLW